MMATTTTHGFWHGTDRDDLPHLPPDDMNPEVARIFTALQIAFLQESVENGAYVSFLRYPTVSLDGKFQLDKMAQFLAEVIEDGWR